MGRIVMSEAFRVTEIAKMDGFVKGLCREYELTTGETIVKKWVILRLTAKNIAFTVHNIGCGVTKITTDGRVCPRCHGTGKVT